MKRATGRRPLRIHTGIYNGSAPDLGLDLIKLRSNRCTRTPVAEERAEMNRLSLTHELKGFPVVAEQTENIPCRYRANRDKPADRTIEDAVSSNKE
jgi:hypothetical protein